MNPFGEQYNEEQELQLIQKSIEGNRKALNKLLERHNLFIYNVAIKMLGNLPEAQDLSQDILIKVTTNLAKYDPEKGKFRSWLYRLAFNYILDYKKSPVENQIRSFSQFFDTIGAIEDEPIDVESGYLDDKHPYTDEVKIKCTSGMLLCLNREERLLFIVGELFKVDHNLGAEIFGISRANFRKRLSRIRKDLYEWMHNRCGLVNKNNPCRCNKKTKGFIERGIVDPESLMWNSGYKNRIEDFSTENLGDLEESTDRVYLQLFEEHPMKEPKTADEVLSTVLGDKNIKEIMDL